MKPERCANIGIDNIYLKAQRPPGFYEAGQADAEHRRHGASTRAAAGGIVLCNLNFKETEEVPENADKKRNILATLLRNLKAPFSSGEA